MSQHFPLSSRRCRGKPAPKKRPKIVPAKKKNEPLKKRVLIVDDHPMMRQGLAQLINNEPDLQTCAEAEDAQQALAFVAKIRPDLVLADISLPDKHGLELIKDLQALHPGLAVQITSAPVEATSCIFAATRTVSCASASAQTAKAW